MQTLAFGDSSTKLRGQIYTDYFYGRPGHGETPEADELEHSIFLALDEPIRIPARSPKYEGDYDAIGCEDVRCVQLAGVVDVEFLRENRGRGLELTGSLFHAHTGHHHVPVLISLSDAPVQILDERNTYANALVTSSGTGFLLGAGGFIVTAAHVVAGKLGITITRGLYRGKVTVERIDPDTDIAILRHEPGGELAQVFIRREAKVRPIRTWMPPQLGERIYACGFPLRAILPHMLNMTDGIISAEVGLRTDRFQISAAIQKGNSGGPVYDKCGNLVGIVGSKLLSKKEVVPENVNFAIRTARLRDLSLETRITLQQEESRTRVPAPVLGKIAQQICVEVEGWTSTNPAS